MGEVLALSQTTTISIPWISVGVKTIVVDAGLYIFAELYAMIMSGGTGGSNRESKLDSKRNQHREPEKLEEKLARDEMLSNPENGTDLQLGRDPRWPRSDSWRKMEYKVELTNGEVINLHYQYNLTTGAMEDIKFTK